MQNPFNLTGKIAIVTGASSGLGKQFAKTLAKNGANVAILARRTEKLAETKALLDELGSNTLSVKCDITQPSQVAAAVSEIKSHYGRIDILVNNAGVATSAKSIDHPTEEWQKVIDTNLNGVFYMTREVGKIMVRQNYGKIINLGSIHSKVAMPGLPLAAYCASKGAIDMLTKALAVEWADNGITVNAIGPSYFPSEMTGSALARPEFLARLKNLCPAGRPGKPEELDGALLYFASDASSFTTGQLLNIDGGWTAI
jgi:gluconate 5-dehydrogenase